jgi:hypothetical protein
MCEEERQTSQDDPKPRSHELGAWFINEGSKLDEEEGGEELDEPKWTTLRLRTYI